MDWTNEQDKMVLKMQEERKTTQEISAAVGHSPACVIYRLALLSPVRGLSRTACVMNQIQTK